MCGFEINVLKLKNMLVNMLAIHFLKVGLVILQAKCTLLFQLSAIRSIKLCNFKKFRKKVCWPLATTCDVSYLWTL